MQSQIFGGTDWVPAPQGYFLRGASAGTTGLVIPAQVTEGNAEPGIQGAPQG